MATKFFFPQFNNTVQDVGIGKYAEWDSEAKVVRVFRDDELTEIVPNVDEGDFVVVENYDGITTARKGKLSKRWKDVVRFLLCFPACKMARCEADVRRLCKEHDREYNCFTEEWMNNCYQYTSSGKGWTVVKSTRSDCGGWLPVAVRLEGPRAATAEAKDIAYDVLIHHARCLRGHHAFQRKAMAAIGLTNDQIDAVIAADDINGAI